MEETKNTNTKLGLTLAGLAVLGLAGLAVYKNSTTPETAMKINETMPSVAETTETLDNVTMTYRDGKYTKTGDYTSPAGAEKIEVTLTLEDGIVKEADVVSKATHPISVKMQGAFIGAYKEFVIGKKIDSLKLDKMAGSSLTPAGFNEALEEIKAEAQS